MLPRCGAPYHRPKVTGPGCDLMKVVDSAWASFEPEKPSEVGSMMVISLLAVLASPLPEPIRGDFDADGREDVASVVANNDDLLVVVDRAADDFLHVVIRFDNSKGVTIRS